MFFLGRLRGVVANGLVTDGYNCLRLLIWNCFPFYMDIHIFRGGFAGLLSVGEFEANIRIS